MGQVCSIFMSPQGGPILFFVFFILQTGRDTWGTL